MRRREIHDRPWVDASPHVTIATIEIDGRDRWFARDDFGTIAMAHTEEALHDELRRLVITRHGVRHWPGRLF